jgi:phosphoglycerate dehydrogenase-like enzyme
MGTNLWLYFLLGKCLSFIMNKMKRKILLAGRMPDYSKEQLDKIASLNLEIINWPKEYKLIEIDVSDIEIAVGFDVFKYNKIQRFTNLQFIQLTSAGYEHMPIDYIYQHGIKLANARGAFSIAIAETVLGKILEIYKLSRKFYHQQRHHIWKVHPRLDELTNKIVTIVGYGSIGEQIAIRLRAFGCQIHVVKTNETRNALIDKYYHIDDLDQALAVSDVIISTLPLNEKTRAIFDQKRFSQFKPNSIFINVSRGDVVDQTSLMYALKRGHLRAAVLDVFTVEPLPRLSRLWDLKNMYITPHNSYLSKNSELRLFELIYRNVENFLNNRPIENLLTYKKDA